MWRLHLHWRRTGHRTVLGEVKCGKCKSQKRLLPIPRSQMATPIIPLRVRHLVSILIRAVNSQLATLTADGNGDTKEVEVKAGTVYIKRAFCSKGLQAGFY